MSTTFRPYDGQPEDLVDYVVDEILEVAYDPDQPPIQLIADLGLWSTRQWNEAAGQEVSAELRLAALTELACRLANGLVD